LDESFTLQQLAHIPHSPEKHGAAEYISHFGAFFTFISGSGSFFVFLYE
jgi:4-diphosphocytidyl-2C-methyl-D-erythritol kinase